MCLGHSVQSEMGCIITYAQTDSGVCGPAALYDSRRTKITPQACLIGFEATLTLKSFCWLAVLFRGKHKVYLYWRAGEWGWDTSDFMEEDEIVRELNEKLKKQTNQQTKRWWRDEECVNGRKLSWTEGGDGKQRSARAREQVGSAWI